MIYEVIIKITIFKNITLGEKREYQSGIYAFSGHCESQSVWDAVLSYVGKYLLILGNLELSIK